MVIARMHVGLLVLVGTVACRSSDVRNDDTTTRHATNAAPDSVTVLADCDSGARRVVDRLGERMRQVSLLAPDSVIRRAIEETYSALASPELRAAWRARPATAPGRDVSSPWPARIAIRSMQPDGHVCRIEGDVIYVTSLDTTAVAARRAVTILLDPRDSLHIIGYQVVSRSAVESSGGSIDNATAAANVVRRYYRFIAAHDYDGAYALWGRSGRASGKTRAEFAAGFAQTVDVQVTIRGVPRVEGAAGSQYATVAVAVDAKRRDGLKQHFTGTYTLRRAVADGATPAQRAWHLYTADLSS